MDDAGAARREAADAGTAERREGRHPEAAPAASPGIAFPPVASAEAPRSIPENRSANLRPGCASRSPPAPDPGQVPSGGSPDFAVGRKRARSGKPLRRDPDGSGAAFEADPGTAAVDDDGIDDAGAAHGDAPGAGTAERREGHHPGRAHREPRDRVPSGSFGGSTPFDPGEPLVESPAGSREPVAAGGGSRRVPVGRFVGFRGRTETGPERNRCAGTRTVPARRSGRIRERPPGMYAWNGRRRRRSSGGGRRRNCRYTIRAAPTGSPGIAFPPAASEEAPRSIPRTARRISGRGARAGRRRRRIPARSCRAVRRVSQSGGNGPGAGNRYAGTQTVPARRSRRIRELPPWMTME